MAKAKLRMPDLSNATPEMIADELGKVRAIKTMIGKLEEFYKTAFHARRGSKTEIYGESFEGAVTASERTALDSAKLQAYCDKNGIDIAQFKSTTPVETLRTTMLLGGKPVNNEDLVAILTYLFPEGEKQEAGPMPDDNQG